jgi:omega-6 fatty acid desaturase (delta-12 desaturase)
MQETPDLDQQLIPRQPDPSPRQTDPRTGMASFESPSAFMSVFQAASTAALFAASCAAMYWSLSVSYWLTLLLAIPTAGLLVRIFIIQHDCGHGAFFRSGKLNELVGTLCSLVTFAPYRHWRRQHAGHHANWNNLDRRESGADMYSSCLTVTEYAALSHWNRFLYRAVRHAIIAHILIPPTVFMVLYRVPFDTPREWTRERRSVTVTNAGILAVFGLIAAVAGFRNVLLVQLPVIVLASIVGVWLFSLQHRFEGAMWARQSDWSVAKAALQGSSYLRLPAALQWFTGNIGFHHVHHLSPRIPNYRLAECHRALPALQGVKTIGWLQGLGATRLALWDEAEKRLIRFSDL